MGAFRCGRSGRAAWALALLGAGPAAAEPAARGELSALFDSGNVLPGAPAEAPFWEALGSLRSGRGNRARLGLSADDPGYVPRLRTSARLRLDVELAGVAEGAAAQLTDASSSLGLSWRAGPETRLSLSAHPFDTDYRRLGYLHALDWGGSHVERRESIFLARRAGAPGVFFALERSNVSLFVGAKWTTTESGVAGTKRLAGGLGGGSARLGSALRVDLGFGYFEREAGFVEGTSMRLVWHAGITEPETSAEPFRPPPLREDTEQLSASAPHGAALALEGALLVVRAPAERQLLRAPAISLYGSVRGAAGAMHAVVTWRSLPFVLRSDPRHATEPALWEAAQQAELTAWAGGSLSLARPALVPSFELGVRLPGALLARTTSLAGVGQTWIASGAEGLRALPLGSGRLPVLAARVGLRFQASESLSLVLAADYQRDPNRVRLMTVGAATLRVFDAPDALAVVGGLQARF